MKGLKMMDYEERMEFEGLARELKKTKNELEKTKRKLKEAESKLNQVEKARHAIQLLKKQLKEEGYL